MKKLYVYADFDWLKEIELVGELGTDTAFVPGADSRVGRRQAVRRLSSFDYLTGIDDYSRMGGF